MRIGDMNWMQVEDYLRRDDRCVLPLGSTEQHAYLSLAVDCILPERVAAEAAEPLGVPVFPVLSYGVTPRFLAYPGTLSLRPETHRAVLTDLLDSLAGAGFRRILLVNGHGGNTATLTAAMNAWVADHPAVQVRLHDWWCAPRTLAAVKATDPVASHASWMENFPWTRLPGVALPDGAKKAIHRDRLAAMTPAEVRAYLGDGNFAGRYQRPDGEMLAIWEVAVAETRAALEGTWEPA